MTFLALDIGNTRLKWALYPEAQPGAVPLAQGAEFLENIDKLAEGPWDALPAPTHMLGCVVAGDGIRKRVQEQIEQVPHWDVSLNWMVSSEAEAGLTNGYRSEERRVGKECWYRCRSRWSPCH